MRSDTQLVRVPMDGRDLNRAVRLEAQFQAARDPDPRRLVATFTVLNGENMELVLVFELFKQD